MTITGSRRGLVPPSCVSALLTKLVLLCLVGLPPLARAEENTNLANNSTLGPTPTPATTPATTNSYDCIDPNNRERTVALRRGDITTICLYVGPDGNWNDDVKYKRFSVNLIADEFSSYRVPGSFKAVAVGKNVPNFGLSSHIFVASQSSLSFLRRYYDDTTERIYPYLTAVVDVKDGVVRGIAWDDACIFCEQAECTPNTYNFDGSLATTEKISQPVDGCSFTKVQCEGFVIDGSNTCDLNFFVVWTGTDVYGSVLLSSDSRFSMFPPNRIQENVKGRYDSMVENLNNMREKISGS